MVEPPRPPGSVYTNPINVKSLGSLLMHICVHTQTKQWDIYRFTQHCVLALRGFGHESVSLVRGGEHARTHSGPKLPASCCRANYAARNNATPNRAAFRFIRPRSIHLASSFIYQVFIYSPDTLCRPIMGIAAALIMGSPPPTLVLFNR